MEKTAYSIPAGVVLAGGRGRRIGILCAMGLNYLCLLQANSR